MIKAALYARVSKDEQHAENQLPEIHAFSKRMDWEPIEYIENASAKEGSRRPVLAKLLADAEAKKFGAVVIWKIDRFGRSLTDFCANVKKLDTYGVRFVATSQSIDTDQKSPFAKLLMHILAVFAEFERDMIVERVNLGLKRYKADLKAGRVGKTVKSKSGKNAPLGRPREFIALKKAIQLRADGWSWRKVAKELGVNQSTLRLRIKENA